MKKTTKKLIREIVGGEPYEYYSVGRHIVVAPGVCGGRPTFKYTRIDVRHALSLLAAGHTVARIAQNYHLPVAAVREAVALAAKALTQETRGLGQRQTEGAGLFSTKHCKGWGSKRQSASGTAERSFSSNIYDQGRSSRMKPFQLCYDTSNTLLSHASEEEVRAHGEVRPDH